MRWLLVIVVILFNHSSPCSWLSVRTHSTRHRSYLIIGSKEFYLKYSQRPGKVSPILYTTGHTLLQLISLSTTKTPSISEDYLLLCSFGFAGPYFFTTKDMQYFVAIHTFAFGWPFRRVNVKSLLKLLNNIALRTIEVGFEIILAAWFLLTYNYSRRSQAYF